MHNVINSSESPTIITAHKWALFGKRMIHDVMKDIVLLTGLHSQIGESLFYYFSFSAVGTELSSIDDKHTHENVVKSIHALQSVHTCHMATALLSLRCVHCTNRKTANIYWNSKQANDATQFQAAGVRCRADRRALTLTPFARWRTHTLICAFVMYMNIVYAMYTCQVIKY